MTIPGLKICLDLLWARFESQDRLFETPAFQADLDATKRILLTLENDADGRRIVEEALSQTAGVPDPAAIGSMVQRALSAETRKVPQEALKPAAKAPEKQAPVERPPVPEPPYAPPGVKALLLAEGMEAEFKKMHPGEPVPNFIREKVARAQALVNQHREAA